MLLVKVLFEWGVKDWFGVIFEDYYIWLEKMGGSFELKWYILLVSSWETLGSYSL